MVKTDFGMSSYFMKYLFILFLLISFQSSSQPLKSGTYIFKYCDLEYNRCLSTCKVVIKAYSITVYATTDLAKVITGTKPDDVLKKGKLVKNNNGEWVIKDLKENEQNTEDIYFINFKKREFWNF